MSPVLLLLIFATLFLLSWYLLVKWNKSKWKNAPPGPVALPLIGNALQMGKLMHETWGRMALKYGALFRLEIFGQRFVIVEDPKLVKQLFSDLVFTGRGDNTHVFDVLPQTGVKHGIIIGEGSSWEDWRRFTLRELRDRGFGKSMETSILNEVTDFMERIKAEGDKPIGDLKHRLVLGVINSLWTLVAGERTEQDDGKTSELVQSADDAFFHLFEKCSPVVFLSSWFAYTFPRLTGYGKFRSLYGKYCHGILQQIEEHQRTIQPEIERDFIDTCLNKISKCTDATSGFYGNQGMDHLHQVILDLYFAGSDTTSSVLAWTMLYLSKYPECQQKLFEEIAAVTGNARSTMLKDRSKMPYTEAVIAECLRRSSVAAQGAGHRAIKDMMIGGYLFPKDTIVFADIYNIHHNQKIWGDPWTFRPERFLSKDGKSFQRHEALIPFSIGRRQCLGEPLARDTLFLFLTNIVQRFEIVYDNDGPENNFEPIVTAVLLPKPYQVFFKERHG